MNDFRYQAIDITVPAGTDGATSYTVEMDPNYRFITGLAVTEKADGGIASYDLAFADDTRTYHDYVDKRFFIADTGVAVNDRFKDVQIENSKQRFRIRVSPDAVTASPIRFQMVFRLAKELPQ